MLTKSNPLLLKWLYRFALFEATMASLKGVTVSYPSILHFCCYICKSPHTDDISIFIVVVVLFFLFPPFLSVQFFAFFIYLPVRFCNTTGSFFFFASWLVLLYITCSTSSTLEHSYIQTPPYYTILLWNM